jgi:uncharacterized membrane protein YkvA (DUF1232 family)
MLAAMLWWQWTLVVAGALVVIACAVALLAQRHRQALVELVKLIAPCLKLIRDVLRDPSVARRHKIVPAVALGYLVFPIDLIPDFIPVLGQLDDALVVAWTLRHIVRSAGRERIEHHWTSDGDGLRKVLRLAGIDQLDDR